MAVNPTLKAQLLILAVCLGGFLGMVVLVGTLDRHAEWQERTSYHALTRQLDSLEREVDQCRATTTRMGARLTTLEQVSRRSVRRVR